MGQITTRNLQEPIVDENGVQRWYDAEGNLHRAKPGSTGEPLDNDLPAVIWPDGSQKWYQHGQLHRDYDLPAVIRPYYPMLMVQEWYQNGLKHRDGDEPAVIRPERQEWYYDGLLHRENHQPAVIERALNGTLKIWYIKGIRKRYDEYYHTSTDVQTRFYLK